MEGFITWDVGGQVLAPGHAREHVIHVTAQVSVRRVKEGESVEMRLFKKKLPTVIAFT